MAKLVLSPEVKTALWGHLLPDPHLVEQGAFLLCRCDQSDELEFHVLEFELLASDSYVVQARDYLELRPEVQQRLIRRAHELDACLIEMHSHLGRWKAEFSNSDFFGFTETVPHMRWRLRGKPYAAVVVAQSDYDALVWRERDVAPESLTGICIDGVLVVPTGLSQLHYREPSAALAKGGA